jgi:hypothetical protein
MGTIVVPEQGESLQEIVTRMEQKNPHLRSSASNFRVTKEMQREAATRDKVDRRKFPDYD